MHSSWQNWTITNQLLNSPFYRPYLWTRVTVDTWMLPLRAILASHTQRRFHAYVVGTAKSGTTSLGRVLKKYYKTDHEALPRESVVNTVLYRQGKISIDQFCRYIRYRDRILCLELESSLFLLDWIEILVKEFPAAKFILPIRNCYSWLESMINQNFLTNSHVQKSYWKMLFDDYFDDTEANPKYDFWLLEKGIHSIPSYLKHWTYHNQKIIEAVPPERLLVLKTNEINNQVDKIADFLEIPKNSFNLKRIYQNKTLSRPLVLSSIPQSYIISCVNRYCFDLMTEYFPEIL